MRSSTFTPDRCQSIRVCTANRCRRSWIRGCTSSVRRPIRVMISLNVVVQANREHRGAGAGEKERARPWSWAQPVSFGRRSGATPRCGRVQRHQPRPVAFRFADRDHTGVEIDVFALERERLADPHAGHGQQPEQRLIARRAHRVAQPPRLRQQPADVLLGEQVRGGALTAMGEDVRRRDLGRRVERWSVGGTV